MPNASEKDVAFLAAELVDAQWEALRRRDSYICAFIASGSAAEDAVELAKAAMAIVDEK